MGTDRTNEPSVASGHPWLKRGDGWTLIERWCETYPSDWRLYFERPDGATLEVSVSEEVWRAFDGIKVPS